MHVEPHPIIWGSLLKACKIHRNLEIGKEIGKLVTEMNPDHSGRYIQLFTWQTSMNNEKETAINQHSEKLAVAFGLTHTKPGTGIRIFKNLNVCEDCHDVMKLISGIYNREIVMRDIIWFHCSRDGRCSCADYW
ncbi:unnamed protein product [Linum tenue]|uniref:DYW domain-containing protein n=1 Tax=Linum tenue TaxID=586396 RepID=A0AAV0I5G0_9ROSI|nr:unnamed protein product [Linum tenue]